MSASRTVRGYVARDGAVLLRPTPGTGAAVWLADLLRALAGTEVLVTVTVVRQSPPDWLPGAPWALERPAWALERGTGGRGRKSSLSAKAGHMALPAGGR